MSTITLDQLNNWNNILQKNINDISPATKYQQSNYQMQTVNMMYNVYTILFWIYIAFALILSGCIYMYVDINKYIKVLIILLILAYPFYIYKLEQYIYALLAFIYSMFTSTIYSNVYLNQY